MLFVLCQLAVVAVVLALCALAVPVSASFIASGALVVVIPNAAITLLMRRANAGALVMLAMVRSFVIAITVIAAYLLLEPLTLPYFIGAGVGLAVITFVPIVLTLLRPTSTGNSKST